MIEPRHVLRYTATWCAMAAPRRSTKDVGAARPGTSRPLGVATERRSVVDADISRPGCGR